MLALIPNIYVIFWILFQQQKKLKQLYTDKYKMYHFLMFLQQKQAFRHKLANQQRLISKGIKLKLGTIFVANGTFIFLKHPQAQKNSIKVTQWYFTV